jgi:hypothetical protein
MSITAVAFDTRPRLEPPLAPDDAPDLRRETERELPPERTPQLADGPKFEPEVGDFRFRALMSEEHWSSLPVAIRRRFSKRLARTRGVVYSGEVLETWMARRGWWLAQAARLIGGPLPAARSAHLPSVVTVTEDRAKNGQVWTRLYARKRGFPQVIHSSKRFDGDTGLEEYVGRGIGMSLTVYARDGALVFRSKDYFVQLFGRRLRLPAWLTPGAIYVTHAELPDGKFSFTLQIIHPRHGLLLRQMAIFREL